MGDQADGFWSMAGNLVRYEDRVSFIAPDQLQKPTGRRLREAAEAALAATAGQSMRPWPQSRTADSEMKRRTAHDIESRRPAGLKLAATQVGGKRGAFLAFVEANRARRGT
jgi:hypothetical protein